MRPAWRRGPGRLIAFEGIDGSGKSTQARLLFRWLQAQGAPVAQTSWNSSPLVAPAIRRGKNSRSLVPVTYSLVHACDFADRFEREILPHLEAGHTVVADRYAFTGMARDTARGVDPRWVRELYDFAPLPHLTFYCEIAPETAVKRLLDGRPRIKYYEAGIDVDPDARDRRRAFVRFQGRIAAEYRAMSEEFGFRRLDATRPLAEQQRVIREAVLALVDGLAAGTGEETEAGDGTEGGAAAGTGEARGALAAPGVGAAAGERPVARRGAARGAAAAAGVGAGRGAGPGRVAGSGRRAERPARHGADRDEETGGAAGRGAGAVPDGGLRVAGSREGGHA